MAKMPSIRNYTGRINTYQAAKEFLFLVMKSMRKWKVVLATQVIVLTVIGCEFMSSGLGATETQTPTPFTITINPDNLVFEPGIRMIKHGINSSVSGLGFKVWVSGVDENSVLIVDMIGPEGEQIVITPTVQRESIEILLADISFTIPYDTEGLYPGLWFINIIEPEKMPPQDIKIPKLHCFSDGYEDCILDFSAFDTPVAPVAPMTLVP
jgi:hypothetical protein